MPNLNEVYRAFGFAAEAAQLLETELATLLIENRCGSPDLLTSSDAEQTIRIIEAVNQRTLGQLLKALKATTQSVADLESELSKALRERNRLFHSFFREHNFRRNSEEGRLVMIKDIESIHSTVFKSYKAVMRLSGIDLDALINDGRKSSPPTAYVPI
jgi:hypothetical protein